MAPSNALHTNAPLATSARPDAGTSDPQTVDSSVRAQSSLRAESVEADTIRVRTLRAITLEAGELRAKETKRVHHFPVAKDEGMVKLEGDLVEADQLEAHHVRARLVVADEVTVQRIIKLHGDAPGQGSADQAEVINRCVHLIQRTDGVVARCTRGISETP